MMDLVYTEALLGSLTCFSILTACYSKSKKMMDLYTMGRAWLLYGSGNFNLMILTGLVLPFQGYPPRGTTCSTIT